MCASAAFTRALAACPPDKYSAFPRRICAHTSETNIIRFECTLLCDAAPPQHCHTNSKRTPTVSICARAHCLRTVFGLTCAMTRRRMRGMCVWLNLNGRQRPSQHMQIMSAHTRSYETPADWETVAQLVAYLKVDEGEHKNRSHRRYFAAGCPAGRP
jgi:hypothetical protein